MHANPDANFAGDDQGAPGAANYNGTVSVDRSDLGGDRVVFPDLHRNTAAEGANPSPPTTPTHESQVVPEPVRLTRETPFGITAIVGGTNVRFCLSVPHNREPIVYSVSWKDLETELGPGLKAQELKFEDSKELVLSEIAKRFAEFVKKQFPEDGSPPPFHNICAFDLSVAGIVTGEGSEAAVTTTNTGINLKGEALALSLLAAINCELSDRKWPNIPHGSTAVLNDAAAGALGEYYAGALRDFANGLFVIIGTGVGSMALVEGRPHPKFSELGHSLIVNFEKFKKRFSLHDGAQISELLDSTGNFKELELGKSYIENHLAGPWFAINFVRKLTSDQLAPVLKVFAEKLEKKLTSAEKTKIAEQTKAHLEEELSPEDLLHKALFFLGDRQVSSRPRWAMDSSSALITAINKYILVPDPVQAWQVTPCTGKSEEWLSSAKPEHVLNYLAWIEHWKMYFKEVGEALGAVYRQMKKDGVAPGKIVLGGGIAEACQKYLPEDVKAHALELIHDHGHKTGHLPKDTVVFSTMSPEARESAITLRQVNQIYEYWLKTGEWATFWKEST